MHIRFDYFLVHLAVTAVVISVIVSRLLRIWGACVRLPEQHLLYNNFADISNIVICGIEAHACVKQTVVDLLSDTDYNIHVVVDAVSSRNMVDRLAIIRHRRLQLPHCVIPDNKSIGLMVAGCMLWTAWKRWVLIWRLVRVSYSDCLAMHRIRSSEPSRGWSWNLRLTVASWLTRCL